MNLVGVVLCREKLPVPTDSRLIDLQGVTTILEAVELVKGAVAYPGVDSWASVLAAKLLPAPVGEVFASVPRVEQPGQLLRAADHVRLADVEAADP